MKSCDLCDRILDPDKDVFFQCPTCGTIVCEACAIDQEDENEND